MSEQKDKEIFEYTYSAPTEAEKKQIENIKRQYSAESATPNAFERLKKLDGKVKNTAIAVSIIFGVVGTLIFGLGLTFILEWNIWPVGIALMIVGVIPMIIAYPSYNFAIKKGKEKYGEEIVNLAEEILKKE